MKTMIAPARLLIIAGLLSAAFCAQASQLPDYPFIHASGSAYVFVTPNLGELDFEVNVPQKEPEAAVAVAQKRVEEIGALLAAQGVATEDVEIHALRKEMHSQSNDGEYDLRCAIHVNVRDLSKWRDIVLPLLNMANIDGLEANFGTTERDKLEHDLMTSAVRDAQARADAMASALGKHVGAVTAISSAQLRDLSTSIGLVPSDKYFTEQNAPHAPMNPADLLTISPKKMTQSVDVVFRIR